MQQNIPYKTAKEVAEDWEITQRRVAVLCVQGRIENATMIGNMWLIPKNAQKPIDARTLRSKDKLNKAKPFIKWAGGKSQTLNEIQSVLPKGLGKSITKYAEPFVGGGAVLFDLLSKYEFEEVYINDVNKELINTYKAIRDNCEQLIERLNGVQEFYYNADKETQKQIYYDNRTRFNELIAKGNKVSNIEKAALFIFLNKTCFNGLYRVNKKGLYNVPMGDYKKPIICDSENLRNASILLRKVRIECADFKKAEDFIDNETLVYFDPPYRPLTATSDFTAYSENGFGDKEQIQLAAFAKEMTSKGAKIILSNSDPKNINESDDFFDKIYDFCHIKRISASRMINSKGNSRGQVYELLIKNF